MNDWLKRTDSVAREALEHRPDPLPAASGWCLGPSTTWIFAESIGLSVLAMESVHYGITQDIIAHPSGRRK